MQRIGKNYPMATSKSVNQSRAHGQSKTRNSDHPMAKAERSEQGSIGVSNLPNHSPVRPIRMERLCSQRSSSCQMGLTTSAAASANSIFDIRLTE
jgi:hypothetical protein